MCALLPENVATYNDCMCVCALLQKSVVVPYNDCVCVLHREGVVDNRLRRLHVSYG